MIRVLAFVVLTMSMTSITPISAGSMKPIPAEAVAPLPKVDKEATPALIALLQDQRESYRAAAAGELGRRKEVTAVGALRALLTDTSERVRLSAAGALLALGDTSGVPLLKDTVANRPPTPALKAAYILASSGDESGMDLALRKLSSKYFTERMSALKVLNKAKDEEAAYRALETGLKDSEHLVRSRAMTLLGERPELRSFRMVSPFLSSPEMRDRWSAMAMIVKMRLNDTIPALIDVLNDPEGAMRYAAAAWLNDLTGQKRNPIFASKEQTRAAFEREWREWWEANKSKYPSGSKLPTLPVQETPKR